MSRSEKKKGKRIPVIQIFATAILLAVAVACVTKLRSIHKGTDTYPDSGLTQNQSEISYQKSDGLTECRVIPNTIMSVDMPSGMFYEEREEIFFLYRDTAVYVTCCSKELDQAILMCAAQLSDETVPYTILDNQEGYFGTNPARYALVEYDVDDLITYGAVYVISYENSTVLVSALMPEKNYQALVDVSLSVMKTIQTMDENDGIGANTDEQVQENEQDQDTDEITDSDDENADDNWNGYVAEEDLSGIYYYCSREELPENTPGYHWVGDDITGAWSEYPDAETRIAYYDDSQDEEEEYSEYYIPEYGPVTDEDIRQHQGAWEYEPYTEIEINVTGNEGYEYYDFQVSYEYTNAKIIHSWIEDPDGIVIKDDPDEIMAGNIDFFIHNPKAGVWTVHIQTNYDYLGIVTGHIMDRAAIEKWQSER